MKTKEKTSSQKIEKITRKMRKLTRKVDTQAAELMRYMNKKTDLLKGREQEKELVVSLGEALMRAGGWIVTKVDGPQRSFESLLSVVSLYAAQTENSNGMETVRAEMSGRDKRCSPKCGSETSVADSEEAVSEHEPEPALQGV